MLGFVARASFFTSSENLSAPDAMEAKARLVVFAATVPNAAVSKRSAGKRAAKNIERLREYIRGMPRHKQSLVMQYQNPERGGPRREKLVASDTYACYGVPAKTIFEEASCLLDAVGRHYESRTLKFLRTSTLCSRRRERTNSNIFGSFAIFSGGITPFLSSSPLASKIAAEVQG